MSDFSAGAQGALGGAGVGASVGTAIMPGVGTVVGALLGGAVGAFSGVEKNEASKNAMAKLMAVPSVDPNQLAFKDQLYREKKAVESGFTTDFQVARDIIGQSEAGGMSVASEMAQSNPALALMAMDQVGKGTDNSVNKALGTISTRSMGYTSMVDELIDKMSQRKIQVDLFKAQQGMATATKGMNDFNANSNAGMMKLMDPSVMDGFSKFAGMFANTPGVTSPLASAPTGFLSAPTLAPALNTLTLR